MEIKEANKTLNDVSKLVLSHPNVTYYLYHGLVFSETDIFCRFDKMYTYALYLLNNTPVIQKIVGVKEHTQDNEPIVRISTDLAYKVGNGRRRGRIVSKTNIYDIEQVELVNKPRPLVLSSEHPDGLNIGNAADAHILDCLFGLKDFDTHHIPVIPAVYLSSTGDTSSLYLRDCPEAQQYIKETNGYRKDKSLAQNLTSLSENCFWVDAGKGRRAYPFEYIYGKGVVVVDMSSFGEWFASEQFEFPINEKHLSLDLRVPKCAW